MHCSSRVVGELVLQSVLLFVLVGAVSANILRKKFESNKDANDDVIIITDFKGDSLSGLLQQLRSNSTLRPLSERIEKTIKSSNLQNLPNYPIQHYLNVQPSGPYQTAAYPSNPYRFNSLLKTNSVDKSTAGKSSNSRFSYKIIDKFSEKLNDKYYNGEKTSNKFYDKLTDKGLFFKPYFGFGKYNNKLDNKLDSAVQQNRFVSGDTPDSNRNLDLRNHYGYPGGNSAGQPTGQPTAPHSNYPSNLNHLSNFNEFKGYKPVTYPAPTPLANYYPLQSGYSYYGPNYSQNYNSNYNNPNYNQPNYNQNYNSNLGYSSTYSPPAYLPYYPKAYYGYKPPDNQLTHFDQNKYLPVSYDQNSFSSLPGSSASPPVDSHDKNAHHHPLDQSTGQSSLSPDTLELDLLVSNSSDNLDKRQFLDNPNLKYKTLYPPSVPFILNNLNNYQATKNRAYLLNLSQLGNQFVRPANGFTGGAQFNAPNRLLNSQSLNNPPNSAEQFSNLSGNSSGNSSGSSPNSPGDSPGNTPNQSPGNSNDVINSLINKLNEKKLLNSQSHDKTPAKPFISSNQLLFNITSEQEIDLLKDKVLTSLLLSTYLSSMAKPKGNTSISRSDTFEDDSQGKGHSLRIRSVCRNHSGNYSVKFTE